VILFGNDVLATNVHELNVIVVGRFEFIGLIVEFGLLLFGC
jgi:hypothetical protein